MLGNRADVEPNPAELENAYGGTIMRGRRKTRRHLPSSAWEARHLKR